MLRQIIQEYLISHAHVPPEKFDDPEVKISDFGLDSLGVVEMLFEIEDRYGFQIESPFRYNDMRFTDVVADLEATIRARNNGQLPELKHDGLTQDKA